MGKDHWLRGFPFFFSFLVVRTGDIDFPTAVDSIEIFEGEWERRLDRTAGLEFGSRNMSHEGRDGNMLLFRHSFGGGLLWAL